MDKHYPIHQRMALPGAKPPRAPNQRSSLPVTRHQLPPTKLEVQAELNQSFNRSGRDPVRRRKPVPMPRTIRENAIDVPPEFEMAAYNKPPKKINNNAVANMNYHQQSSSLPPTIKTRPKSMLESTTNRRDNYRVCIYFQDSYLIIYTNWASRTRPNHFHSNWSSS